jgi:energy-coupling factor transporter ATP-binding protein EcfA2
MERHGLKGTPDSPKLPGTSNPNPSECDKTATAPTAAPESPAGAPADITAVIKQHLDAPVVAVVGPQGAGKSTFLQWLYGQIPGAAIALDPHAAKGDHGGLVVVGAGMDYEAIDSAVTQIRELVEERYRARAQGITTFPKLLVVVEELTNWASKVASAKALIKEALSDFRKVSIQLILVSHGKTNALMGGSDGMAELRESGMLLLEISEKGKGTLTIPGAQRRRIAVSIPLLESQPINRPGLPFRLGDRPIVTPPPADTPQSKVIRHLTSCPEGIPQGALIQKVADLKTMGKDAAVQFLTRMVLEGQIQSETTDQSVRYFTA